MLTQQFRIRYPQGSLISELVTIDRGQYIVRTLVQVEGFTLATALAAADTVEQAEDRSINRALSVLALDSTTTTAATPAQTWEQQTSKQSSSETTSANTRQQGQQDTNKIVSDNSLPQSQPKRVEFAKPTKQEQKSQTLPLEREFASTVSETVTKESQSFTPPPDSNLHEPTTKDNYLNSSNITETDYSDVIAKTDFELQRLRWTKEQGVNHLLQIYGKRSRLTLSDGELLEFLHYLESQPTPN